MDFICKGVIVYYACNSQLFPKLLQLTNFHPLFVLEFHIVMNYERT